MSCIHRNTPEEVPRMSPDQEEEMLLRVNKYLVQKDIELIRSYASRRGWNMEVSETGLFYEVYEKTSGMPVQQGMKVRINFEISLLDGSVCYTSDLEGPKEFRLGKSGEIAGLEQGLQMMRKGEKARLIIPPHLGYGLLGDEKRIPARSIIVYLLELEEITTTE